MRMNKKQLIDVMAKKAAITPEVAGKALDAFVDSVTEALKAGENVQLVGVFSFQVIKRPARVGRNPATGAVINVPAKKVIKFKAGKSLEDAIK